MPILLFHGSGAGCATLSNFKAVLGPLSKRYRVLAADLVGFGQSGRKASMPFFDMEMWERQVLALTTRFPSQRVGLVGHSLAGSVVLKVAAGRPQVAGVVTTGTAGRSSIPNSGGPGWRFPDNTEQLRQGIQRTLFDKSLVDDEEIARRMRVLSAPGYRAYFEAMFSNSKAALVEAMAVPDDMLRAIACPVTLMHGRDDATFTPEDTSLAMSLLIPRADVTILNRCAHSVALEYPEKFLAAVHMTFPNAEPA
jgi:pimeloyl-ACP methyl ester carboxylesterase